MESLFSFLSNPSCLWLRGLIGLSLKASLILIAAWAATLLLKRHSASTRHLVWLVAFIGVLALPLFSALTPSLELSLLPDTLLRTTPDGYAVISESNRIPEEADGIGKIKITGEKNTSHLFTGRNPKSEEKPGVSATASLPTNSSNILFQNWAVWIALAWGAGAISVFILFVRNYFGALRFARKTETAGKDWQDLLGKLAKEIGLRNRVVLLVSKSNAIPVTTGILNPKVILPASCYSWPAVLRRSVLLHELAHVKRRDILNRLIAYSACILYWFNPLVWIAAHRMSAESEKASDDAALTAGATPSRYAHNLLEVAAMLRTGESPSWAHIAMARNNNFKERVMAILKTDVNRNSLSRKVAVTITFLSALAIAPLAAIQPWFRAEAAEIPDSTNIEKSQADTEAQIELLIRGRVQQGSPILLELKSSKPIEHASGNLLDQKISFAGGERHMKALAAIALETEPGIHEIKITVRFADETETSLRDSIEIDEKVFLSRGTVSLAHLSPDPDLATRARTTAEGKLLKDTLANSESQMLWTEPFQMPAAGRTSFAFGESMTFDGKKRIHHQGVDISMPSGTPLKSCNAGKVILARDLLNYGLTVFIDHGLGTISGYTHLSKIRVEEGQIVDKDDLIGQSGNTGRSTGPHLHWELIINGIHCDPLGILELE